MRALQHRDGLHRAAQRDLRHEVVGDLVAEVVEGQLAAAAVIRQTHFTMSGAALVTDIGVVIPTPIGFVTVAATVLSWRRAVSVAFAGPPR